MKTLASISFSIILTILLTLPTAAQVSPAVQQLFYRGYLAADSAPWEQAIQQLEQDASLSDLDRLSAITEAQVGLLVSALAHQDQAAYDKVAGSLESNLEILLENDENDATALARLARLHGATMAFQRWKAAYLSPLSNQLVDRALKADPENPEAWVQRGGSRYFTPAMFGGDADEAVAAFEKAVRYYEAQPNHQSNWRYLDALAWLGQAYQKAERPAEATEVFRKALAVEPDFGWVKHQLLPQTTAQTSGQ